MKSAITAAKPVGASEARTHLSKLLARVARGERFMITRHGKPIAQLVPFEARSADSVREAIQSVAAIRQQLSRKGITLASILEPSETLRDLAHTDHRY